MSYISGQRFHANTSVQTSHSVSLTVPGGCKTVLLLAARGYSGDTEFGVVTGATLGGTAMTVHGNGASATTNLGAALLSLQNPSTGSQTLAVTWDETLGRYDFTVVYLDDTSALSGGAVGTVNGSNGAAVTITSETGATVYGLVFARDSGGAPSITAGAGETVLESFANQTGWGGNSVTALLSKAGATNVTIDPSISTADSGSVAAAISVAASGGGSPPSTAPAAAWLRSTLEHLW